MTELPARWSTLQRYKNHLLYGLIRLLFGEVQLLPLRVATAIARLLGHLAPHLARRDTARAQRHVQQALQLPRQQARRLTRAMYVHLAQNAVETAHLDKLDIVLPQAAKDTLDAALAQGKGVVAVTGHIGNWELLAQAVAQSGYPISTVAKPLYDPRLTAWVNTWRTARGLQIIWRGQNPKAMLRVFRQGGILAFLMDQDTKVPGAFVPFFGRPAFTPTAPAILALRTGAPIVVGFHRRVGSTHTLTIEPHPFVANGDFEQDMIELTAQLTARLENIIRAAPEQWVWLHKRWR